MFTQAEGQAQAPWPLLCSGPYLCTESGDLLPEGCVGANGKVFLETPWHSEVGWVRDDPEMRHLYSLPLGALVGPEGLARRS